MVNGALLLILLGSSAPLSAPRNPMPEPLLGESVTDIDGTEAGEVEFDLTGAALASSRSWQSSVEVEWRALRRLGLALEASTSGGFSTGISARDAFGLRAAASFSLLHDLARELHVQAEVSGRIARADGIPEAAEPGDSALRLAFGLRAGLRRGLWTLRAGAGAEALGHSAHLLPVWASLAGLYALGPGGTLGFAGLEVNEDWGQTNPLLLAPTAVLNVAVLHFPFRVGVALPLAPGGHGSPFTACALLRVMVETDSD